MPVVLCVLTLVLCPLYFAFCLPDTQLKALSTKYKESNNLLGTLNDPRCLNQRSPLGGFGKDSKGCSDVYAYRFRSLDLCFRAN